VRFSSSFVAVTVKDWAAEAVPANVEKDPVIPAPSRVIAGVSMTDPLAAMLAVPPPPVIWMVSEVYDPSEETSKLDDSFTDRVPSAVKFSAAKLRVWLAEGPAPTA
jgi:hypothetical protein